MSSLWRETRLPGFPPLEGDCKTDVLIIGGGMAGLLCAHFLKQEGVDCLLLEADTIASGVTGNTTAKLTAQHGLCYADLIKRFGREKAAMYLKANLEALDAYRELCREIDCDFETKASYVYSLDDRAGLEREVKALTGLRYPAELVEKLSLPFPTVGAVRFPDQAQFHPLKFLAAITQDLPIREHTRVTELRGYEAVTEQGTVTADKIIVATHFPFLNKHGLYFLKLYQSRSYVLALERAADPDGMYLDASGKGLSLRTAGGYLLLGGGSHRTGKKSEGWNGLRQTARRYWPGSVEKYHWAAQDCMSLDGAPYIGLYSRATPRLYMASGFNKWGMTGSMVAARLLAQRVLGQPSPYAPVFDTGRTLLRPQLAVNGLESTVNLLTPTAPRCPHLGCALKWNRAEHSWDCPCHGSRFTQSGRVLNNPANGDMEKRK